MELVEPPIDEPTGAPVQTVWDIAEFAPGTGGLMEVKLQKSLARSKQYLAEAQEVTPGGAPCGKWWSPNLIYAARAKGAYMTDLDGNEFLDYHCASGSVFLGYSHPEVDAAVIDRDHEPRQPVRPPTPA